MDVPNVFEKGWADKSIKNDVQTIAEALPKEIERVQVIITEYELVPGGALAAMLMRQDVRKAHEAMISGDLVGMIASYKALKEYNL